MLFLVKVHDVKPIGVALQVYVRLELQLRISDQKDAKLKISCLSATQVRRNLLSALFFEKLR